MNRSGGRNAHPHLLILFIASRTQKKSMQVSKKTQQLQHGEITPRVTTTAFIRRFPTTLPNRYANHALKRKCTTINVARSFVPPINNSAALKAPLWCALPVLGKPPLLLRNVVSCRTEFCHRLFTVNRRRRWQCLVSHTALVRRWAGSWRRWGSRHTISMPAGTGGVFPLISRRIVRWKDYMYGSSRMPLPDLEGSQISSWEHNTIGA